MRKYPFGKDFTRSFLPALDSEPINLPTQNPVIYLFQETRPDVGMATSGAGAIQGPVGTWTESAAYPYLRTYTFTAVQDPDPASLLETRDYYETIRYVSKASGQVQTEIRQLQISRIVAMPDIPGTTIDDIKNVWPGVSSYGTDSQLESFLTVALDDLKVALQAKRLDYEKLIDLHRIKLALAYKVIAHVALNNVVNEDDRHAFRFNQFTKKFETIMESLPIEYDSDGDGEPDSTTTPVSSSLRFYR